MFDVKKSILQILKKTMAKGVKSSSTKLFLKILLVLIALVIASFIYFVTKFVFVPRPMFVSFVKSKTSVNIGNQAIREHYKRNNMINDINDVPLNRKWNMIAKNKNFKFMNSNEVDIFFRKLKSRQRTINKISNLSNYYEKPNETEEYISDNIYSHYVGNKKYQKILISELRRANRSIDKYDVTTLLPLSVAKNDILNSNSDFEEKGVQDFSENNVETPANEVDERGDTYYAQLDSDYEAKYWKNMIKSELLDHTDSSSVPLVVPQGTKLILFYSRLWSGYEWEDLPMNSLEDITNNYKCSIRKCKFTYNRLAINQSDLVVFHLPDERENLNFLHKLRASVDRSINQKWLLFTSETPISFNNPQDMTYSDNLFNLTMTYDYQSDIPLPYGAYRKLRKRDPVPKLRNFAKGRKNAAILFLSNCDIGLRNYAIEIINKYIPVYVGGKCNYKYENKVDCEKTDATTNVGHCSKVIKQYKFHLSFESGFCDDYVTEKYWDNAIQNEVLPIVLNGVSKNRSKIMIPGSYINIQDFTSLEKLGKYLKQLTANDKQYNKYFEWKKKYKKIKRRPWPYVNELICKLCRAAHENPKTKHNYISNWWNEQKCGGSRSENIDILAEKYYQKYGDIFYPEMRNDEEPYQFDAMQENLERESKKIENNKMVWSYDFEASDVNKGDYEKGNLDSSNQLKSHPKKILHNKPDINKAKLEFASLPSPNEEDEKTPVDHGDTDEKFVKY